MAPTTVRTPFTLRSVAHLEEDLTRIRCIGLMSKPWSIKDERMVRELTTRAPNPYEGTI